MHRALDVCHALVCAIIWLSRILLYLDGSTYVYVCTCSYIQLVSTSLSVRARFEAETREEDKRISKAREAKAKRDTKMA